MGRLGIEPRTRGLKVAHSAYTPALTCGFLGGGVSMVGPGGMLGHRFAPPLIPE